MYVGVQDDLDMFSREKEDKLYGASVYGYDTGNCLFTHAKVFIECSNKLACINVLGACMYLIHLYT